MQFDLNLPIFSLDKGLLEFIQGLEDILNYLIRKKPRTKLLLQFEDRGLDVDRFFSSKINQLLQKNLITRRTNHDNEVMSQDLSILSFQESEIVARDVHTIPCSKEFIGILKNSEYHQNELKNSLNKTYNLQNLPQIELNEEQLIIKKCIADSNSITKSIMKYKNSLSFVIIENKQPFLEDYVEFIIKKYPQLELALIVSNPIQQNTLKNYKQYEQKKQKIISFIIYQNQKDDHYTKIINNLKNIIHKEINLYLWKYFSQFIYPRFESWWNKHYSILSKESYSDEQYSIVGPCEQIEEVYDLLQKEFKEYQISTTIHLQNKITQELFDMLDVEQLFYNYEMIPQPPRSEQIQIFDDLYSSLDTILPIPLQICTFIDAKDGIIQSQTRYYSFCFRTDDVKKCLDWELDQHIQVEINSKPNVTFIQYFLLVSGQQRAYKIKQNFLKYITIEKDSIMDKNIAQFYSLELTRIQQLQEQFSVLIDVQDDILLFEGKRDNINLLKQKIQNDFSGSFQITDYINFETMLNLRIFQEEFQDKIQEIESNYQCQIFILHNPRISIKGSKVQIAEAKKELQAILQIIKDDILIQELSYESHNNHLNRNQLIQWVQQMEQILPINISIGECEGGSLTCHHSFKKNKIQYKIFTGLPHSIFKYRLDLEKLKDSCILIFHKKDIKSDNIWYEYLLQQLNKYIINQKQINSFLQQIGYKIKLPPKTLQKQENYEFESNLKKTKKKDSKISVEDQFIQFELFLVNYLDNEDPNNYFNYFDKLSYERSFQKIIDYLFIQNNYQKLFLPTFQNQEFISQLQKFIKDNKYVKTKATLNFIILENKSTLLIDTFLDKDNQLEIDKKFNYSNFKQQLFVRAYSKQAIQRVQEELDQLML